MSITLGANSLADGTSVVVSTGTGGHFDVSNSSAGIFSGGSATLAITGLTANSGYGFQGGARDNTAGATTQSVTVTASTTTLAANPTITSFRVFTTSVTVTLGANGNPAGTTLTISTGTGGHYAVSNSSKGIVGTGDVTLVISNLSTATVYGFQAGTNDSTGSASTQTTVVSASTSTLAVSLTVTSYRVFATSATITLGANTNPDGTVVAVSTGTGGHYAVTNSSAGIFSGGSATLVITGLTANSGYGFQGGARDSTAGAATQSVTVTASTTALAANPTITSFRVFTTSVSVTLGMNGNPAGTTLTISTGTGGHYAVTNSSKGIVGSGDVTSSTLGVAPTITSFRVFTTSISVTLGTNGNTAGTTLTISTGTGGHYAVTNSSKGIVGSGDVTLVISNLSTATAYAFQAGTNDSTAGASTQTTIITASTSTLAVSPTVTSYRVFATSATIILGANTNPDGTVVAVSTGTGGHYAVANSSAGLFSGGSVTLVITGLTANSGYGFQGGARDSTAGAATQSATVAASTTTLAANPTITSFRVFATSISVTLGANGNPAGTTLSISTGTGGHYAVSDSSKGVVGTGDVTLVITGLTANSAYGFQSGANDSSNSASTQTTIITASTNSLGSAPTITSFRVFSTSISVTLGANGNPAGTTLTISTGTGGHYAVSNSSKGIVGSGDVTLLISNLSTATVYAFQAGTNDSTAGASTQTTGITASTSTLAASLTVSSFRVFVTSITVTVGSNGNPDGTAITISTGTGGHFNVSNSSNGIVSGANTTLAITNLTTATV
ncbi:MAG: hypothetical protein HYY63_01280, partial [Elusimicrobia bacterium]|nr:hypothetical protein [Elusimicrobiota bacterium]